MKRSIGSFMVLAVCMTLATSASAKLYKWVDANGNVTYSQTPPPGAGTENTPKVETIELRVPKPSDGGEAAAERTKDLSGAARLDREFEEGERAAREQHEASIKKNCEIARQNMRVLKSAARIKDPSGERFLEPAEIKMRVEDTERDVADYCGN